MSILNVHQYKPLNASQNKVFIPFLLNMTTSFLAILSDILQALNNCKKNVFIMFYLFINSKLTD